MDTKGAGEVRRVHIVYFLSRKGRIEHPHLIRVHLLNLNGVHLRDVKRWLSDLRGKEMPDAYAWSYKRQYKAGYVWQDLLDDDLITPISDNEYVLKGSEISPIFSDNCSCCQNKNEGAEKKSILEASTETYDSPEIAKANSKAAEEIKFDDELWKTPLQIDEEFRASGEVSCSETDDSTILTTSSTFRKSGLAVESSIQFEKDYSAKGDAEFLQDCSTTTKKEKLKGRSNRASRSSLVFRNLLHCSVVDTNDVDVMSIKRNTYLNNKNCENSKVQICRRELMGGSERIADGNWSYDKIRRSNSNNSGHRKTVSAVYKPSAEPNCSQCGKGFKPEKLHTHMKSCRGLKALVKAIEVEKKMARRATTDELKNEPETGLVLNL